MHAQAADANSLNQQCCEEVLRKHKSLFLQPFLHLADVLNPLEPSNVDRCGLTESWTILRTGRRGEAVGHTGWHAQRQREDLSASVAARFHRFLGLPPCVGHLKCDGDLSAMLSTTRILDDILDNAALLQSVIERVGLTSDGSIVSVHVGSIDSVQVGDEAALGARAAFCGAAQRRYCRSPSTRWRPEQAAEHGLWKSER